ncbi:MFS transporter [Glutamicibacter uratoxydans]|uniref:MFS transporter n=1 Tax=Glutamicibacter uratoxydans TaxID=43667 RepID=UPI003D6E37BE
MDSHNAVEALRTPRARVTAGWIAAVLIVHIGINVGFFAPIQVLLGLHSEAITPQQKNATLSLVTGVGAAVSMIANPLFGALSDRTTSRFGRRIPWIVAGTLGGALALLLMSTAHTVSLLVVGWALMQAAGNAALAAVLAVVPDKVPVEQRGTVGGLVALGQTVGILIGAGIGMVAASDLVFGYAIVAVVIALCSIPFVLLRQDVVLPAQEREPFAWVSFLKGFWISPKQYPDFGWAWITRFLLYLSSQLFLVYLLFFLQDELHHPQPATGVLVLSSVYAGFVILSSVVAGRLSDRDGKRKRYVLISAVITAAAALLMAAAPNFAVAIGGAVLLGIGFGAFLAVDYALLTQVLPHADSRAKDLGVINVANSLPQVFAPLIAWLSVSWLGGYATLFICAAVVALAGGLLVNRIKMVA